MPAFRSLRRDAAGRNHRSPGRALPEGTIRVEGTGRIILELCEAISRWQKLCRSWKSSSCWRQTAGSAPMSRYFWSNYTKRIIDY